MTSLLPPEAVCLVYRRYLKSANKIPNVTIRMLLLQQIRYGFRRHQALANPQAQIELVKQAHKDLAVLEDDRLSRTLYINKLGMVSCLDWEVRRTEYHMSPRVKSFMTIFLGTGFMCMFILVANARQVEDSSPEIARMVEAMALRLEADSPEEILKIRERQVMTGIERKRHRINLEDRILSTFNDAPNANIQQPTLRYPDGIVRTRSAAAS